MDATAQERATGLVEALRTNAFQSDDEADAALEELETLVPDPRVADLIFWPGRHPLSANLSGDELTAARIVELALAYRPFEL